MVCSGIRAPFAVQGKLNTEDLLDSKGVNWTSIRPVYIYGEQDLIFP